MQPLQIPTLDGPGRLDQAARLQRRFYQAWQRQGLARRRHRIVLGAVDAVLMICLTLCLLAIGIGLDRMYPVVRPSLGHAVTEDLPRRPFPSCDDAHAAGVFSIPRGSPAYSPDQDSNRNGLACEPA
ncbi:MULTISPECIES: excalibur calcium-binding domain-containing protein [unclassified Phenylobacterium]|uniref:excalibur calcium-binding domain-containing protein n=1 Tax=unclassified Phenylobacterium TaxID=2640670 RepID=UPI00083AD3A6|nr:MULTISPECIES: excalibur calcium-binding domain-containing protein [unclassified Phenylobacterium]